MHHFLMESLTHGHTVDILKISTTQKQFTVQNFFLLQIIIHVNHADSCVSTYTRLSCAYSRTLLHSVFLPIHFSVFSVLHLCTVISYNLTILCQQGDYGFSIEPIIYLFSIVSFVSSLSFSLSNMHPYLCKAVYGIIFVYPFPFSIKVCMEAGNNLRYGVYPGLVIQLSQAYTEINNLSLSHSPLRVIALICTSLC